MKGVNFLCLLPNLQAALVSRLVSLTLSRHAATAVVTVAVFMRNNTMLDRTLYSVHCACTYGVSCAVPMSQIA